MTAKKRQQLDRKMAEAVCTQNSTAKESEKATARWQTSGQN